MKNKGLIITVITLLTILSVALIVFMVSVIKGNKNFSSFKITSDNVIKEVALDKEYEDEINNIEISSTAGDIIVKHSNSSNVRVVVYGIKKLSSSTLEDGKLEVVVKNEECKFFCINQKVSKTIVYVPEDYEGSFNIKDNYGDIEVSDYKNATLNVENNCGDIEVGSINVIDAKNDYGDIEIGKVNKSLNIKTDCGDIEINELNITENSYIKDDFGDIEIGKTNEIFIDAKTSLGDVEINDNYKKSEITLQIRNSCGDIEIDN